MVCLPKEISLSERTLELQQFKHMVSGRSNSLTLIPEPKENHLDIDQIFWSFSLGQHYLFQRRVGQQLSWPSVSKWYYHKTRLSFYTCSHLTALIQDLKDAHHSSVDFRKHVLQLLLKHIFDFIFLSITLKSNYCT